MRRFARVPTTHSHHNKGRTALFYITLGSIPKHPHVHQCKVDINMMRTALYADN